MGMTTEALSISPTLASARWTACSKSASVSNWQEMEASAVSASRRCCSSRRSSHSRGAWQSSKPTYPHHASPKWIGKSCTESRGLVCRRNASMRSSAPVDTRSTGPPRGCFACKVDLSWPGTHDQGYRWFAGVLMCGRMPGAQASASMSMHRPAMGSWKLRIGRTAVRAAEEGVEPDHQRGARHQPRNLRREQQATRGHRVGVRGGLPGRSASIEIDQEIRLPLRSVSWGTQSR